MPGFLSVDTTSDTYYTVEYRHRDTGYWTEQKMFKPNYKITKTVSSHKFLWFTWETTVTKCHNTWEAEDAARVLAIKAARALSDKSVRVRSCDRAGNCTWWDTVWLNGEFKDC